jgi:CHAT domain-containing protein
MRTCTVLAAIACCVVSAHGAPRPRQPPTPPAPEKAELDKLDKELRDLETKQTYVAAIKVAKKLVAVQIKISGADSEPTQRRRERLASLLQRAGDYTEAIALYKEALATTEKLHGADSQQTVTALTMLAGPYWAQNRLDDIDPIYQRILAISERLDGDTSLAFARHLTMYGTLLNSRNEYTAALRATERALQIEEGKLAKNDLQLLGAMQGLAGLYWQMNDKPKAIALYDRVIKLVETAPNSNVMTVGGTIWGVAAMYHWGGRDDLAKPLMKRVVGMYDTEIARIERDKPDDWSLGSMLGMSGYLYQQMGDATGADQRLTRAIALDEKRMGYSGWTAMLAQIRREQGRPKEALALLEKTQAALTKMSPTSANAYDQTIAEVLRDMGDYPRAEQLLTASLARTQKTYGKHHITYGLMEQSLAWTYAAAGDVTRAERLLADSLEIAERQLQTVLKTGTDTDHAVYFARNGYQLDAAINFNLKLAPKGAAATRLGLTTLLRRKGRALDAAAAAIATIRKKLTPADKQLLDDLASARAKLAKLEVAGPTATGDPDDYAKEVAALEAQVQKLEAQVGAKSAAYRAVSQPIELARIQKLVPRTARLIEIVNYQPYDPKAPRGLTLALAPRRYAAYVIAQTGDPTLVDLADASVIDDAVKKFRKAVSDPADKRSAELGRALYDLTMAKLVGALGNATEILIAPDGTLNVVPFSALVDDRGQFLIKRFTFTYLTSGRDLLRVGIKTKAKGGGVIFADPSFDAAPATPKQPANAPAAPASRGRRSADLASLSWPSLPGTAQEAEAVAKTMRGLDVYVGARATESAVKAVHGPRILHLATHGFFLPDAPPPAAAAQSESGAPMMPAPPGGPPLESYENPLLRSGLALAGANKLQSPTGDDDGILTALEASGLDLEGTELVVLSACETGVGKVTNGDGVYGLRRALVISGAETLVMSLWQVDDQATKDLMVGYYKRLAAGRPRSGALRDVQLELSATDKYAHPYYWASFLPAGNNAPL